MKKILLAAILMLLLAPATCLAEEEAAAGIVNHVMAAKIEYVQGKGFFVNGPTHIRFLNPAGSVSSTTRFATLDQLVFAGGTYKVDLKMVEDASGAIIAEASHDSVTIKENRTIRSFVTEWSVNAKAGLYSYQVLINNAVVATFKIDIGTAP